MRFRATASISLTTSSSRRHGEAGEICIGGAGVARGYVGLSDETRARFVPDPFAPADEADARIYRSGDLGRMDANGNIEFLGRVDGQVKIRGFRVELTEIESVLLQADGLRAAACAVREDVAGIQQLVGYVVPGDSPVDEERLRSYLRSHLPVYMVPALIETVTDLPLLPSGKLDRASLPAPRARRAAKDAAGRPLTITERQIAKVWKDLFSPLPVSLDDHFFHDLGGHSLLAARMVSMLRKNPKFARVSVTDVYERPTIASLASALEAAAPRSQRSGAEASTEARDVVQTSGGRHFLAGVLQTVGLYFVFGLRGLQWITPYLVFFLLIEHELPVYESAAWAAVSEMAVFPLLILVAVTAKWLVLGRVRPGRYPLWGRYYLRWWFAQAMVASVPANYLLGTPLLPLFYRLLGARIGRDVYIATDRFAAFDLISIGDGASVDDDASLFGQTVEEGELVIGPVTVGRRCFVGTRAVLREGAVMEDGLVSKTFAPPQRGADPRGRDLGGFARSARLRLETRRHCRRRRRADRFAAPRLRRYTPRSSLSCRFSSWALSCRAWLSSCIWILSNNRWFTGGGAIGWRIFCPSHHDRAGPPQVASRWPCPRRDLPAARRFLCEELDGGPTPRAQPQHPRAASRDALHGAMVPPSRRQAWAVRRAFDGDRDDARPP